MLIPIGSQIVKLFFSDIALAAPAAAKEPSMLELFLLPLAFLFIFYFLMIRPQQKKTKEHQNLLENLKEGDEVVTSGGIIGRIKSVTDTFVTMNVASNTSIKVMKNHVLSLTEKTAPKPKADSKGK